MICHVPQNPLDLGTALHCKQRRAWASNDHCSCATRRTQGGSCVRLTVLELDVQHMRVVNSDPAHAFVMTAAHGTSLLAGRSIRVAFVVPVLVQQAHLNESPKGGAMHA